MKKWQRRKKASQVNITLARLIWCWSVVKARNRMGRWKYVGFRLEKLEEAHKCVEPLRLFFPLSNASDSCAK